MFTTPEPGLYAIIEVFQCLTLLIWQRLLSYLITEISCTISWTFSTKLEVFIIQACRRSTSSKLLIRFNNLIMNLNKVKLKFECITKCKNECIITESSNYKPRASNGRSISFNLTWSHGVKRVLGHYMLGYSMGFQLLTLSMRQ